MRSLLMASAALILSAGFAIAQTTSSAPAPTGAPNAPATTSASPGNMAPSGGTMAPSGGTGQNMMAPSSSVSANGSSAPAPTGAPNAAPAAPGASPGNLAPAKPGTTSMAQPSQPDQTAANSPVAPPAPVKHHHMTGMRMASLPASASAKTYLHIAKMAIHDHQVARADDALSHAETRLLTRSVPASSGPAADDSPAVASIEHARAALGAGNYAEASSDTETAMHQAHGDASDMSTP